MLDPSQFDWLVEFEVVGEPASKANSRRRVTNNRTGKPMFIKSDKAITYENAFRLQCPRIPLIQSDVMVWIDIWYASRRPDLDESLILDGMQGRIYENDRQVKMKIVRHHLDPKNPKAVIRVREISSG